MIHEVTDATFPSVRELVNGRTIVDIEREEGEGTWGDLDQNSVTIVLDDGSRLRFEGWGYDMAGLTTKYEPSSARVDSEVPV